MDYINERCIPANILRTVEDLVDSRIEESKEKPR